MKAQLQESRQDEELEILAPLEKHPGALKQVQVYIASLLTWALHLARSFSQSINDDIDMCCKEVEHQLQRCVRGVIAIGKECADEAREIRDDLGPLPLLPAVSNDTVATYRPAVPLVRGFLAALGPIGVIAAETMHERDMVSVLNQVAMQMRHISNEVERLNLDRHSTTNRVQTLEKRFSALVDRVTLLEGQGQYTAPQARHKNGVRIAHGPSAFDGDHFAGPLRYSGGLIGPRLHISENHQRLLLMLERAGVPDDGAEIERTEPCFTHVHCNDVTVNDSTFSDLPSHIRFYPLDDERPVRLDLRHCDLPCLRHIEVVNGEIDASHNPIQFVDCRTGANALNLDGTQLQEIRTSPYAGSYRSTHNLSICGAPITEIPHPFVQRLESIRFSKDNTGLTRQFRWLTNGPKVTIVDPDDRESNGDWPTWETDWHKEWLSLPKKAK